MKTRPRQLVAEKILTVKIERIVPDGYGIGFTEGLTVFVPLVAPGDIVRARVDRKKGAVAFASLIEILEPSPARIAPPCLYFGRCGGCDFQQLNYNAQLAAKVGIIKDALRRIGKIDWRDEIKIIPSPSLWNYRTRVQWKRDGDKLGYFERNSHQVIDVATCPILSPALQHELSFQHANLTNENFAEIQAVSAGANVSRRLGSKHEIFDENFYAANLQAATREREISISKTETREIYQIIGEFEYVLSAATFFQVNHAILPIFIETVLGTASGSFALDLYSGVGLFTLPLARKFDQVLGIEGNEQSVQFARASANKAALSNIQLKTALVGEWLLENSQNLPIIDLALLDPPRAGAERETIESLLEIKPQQIVYVSCNPATLARDLRLLCENNFYKIEQITAFDFFPQTHHVETVVQIIRTVNNRKPCDSVN